MALRGKYEFDYSKVPFIFDAMFGNQNVSIGLNYNETGDFFTVDLYDSEFNPVIMGEKLVYGKRLWRQSVNPLVPCVDLMPLDESGQTNQITKDNFGHTVFLYQDTVLDGK